MNIIWYIITIFFLIHLHKLVSLRKLIKSRLCSCLNRPIAVSRLFYILRSIRCRLYFKQSASVCLTENSVPQVWHIHSSNQEIVSKSSVFPIRIVLGTVTSLLFKYLFNHRLVSLLSPLIWCFIY